MPFLKIKTCGIHCLRTVDFGNRCGRCEREQFYPGRKSNSEMSDVDPVTCEIHRPNYHGSRAECTVELKFYREKRKKKNRDMTQRENSCSFFAVS
jgi:hypothetical protein